MIAMGPLGPIVWVMVWVAGSLRGGPRTPDPHPWVHGKGFGKGQVAAVAISGPHGIKMWSSTTPVFR